MGEVYRARDSRLDRDVAVKVVGGDVGDEARARLRREARLSAAISHPNLCTIHEVGEQGDELWLAMELLEGESLEDRIARGALAPGEAVDRLLEVLAGLAALHERGVVHRDLKPTNIFLTPHGAKLLDFGLATPTGSGAREATRITRAGMLVGTPLYMAPELWRGEEATPASDLFACGAVLYEAISGRVPFAGASVFEVCEAVVRGMPPALDGAPGIGALDRLIQRSLARDADSRFAGAREMAAELERWKRRAGADLEASARVVRRLLVAPFRLLRPDAGLDFLGGALAESISMSLGGLEGLTVVSPRVLGGAAPGDLAALAGDRTIDVALVGSLLAAGGRVRLTAELVELPGATVRWSGVAEAASDDLFALVDELARQTVEALRLRLSPRDQSRLEQERPADGPAYELYLRAIDLGRSVRDGEALRRARELLRECVERDPRFAPAWAQLGRLDRVLGKFGHAEREESCREARRAFERALTLAPDSALVHHLYTPFEIEVLGAPARAMQRLIERIERRSSDANLFAGLVTACRYCGLLEASLAAAERAQRLDPGLVTSVDYTWWIRGDYARACEADRNPTPFVRNYSWSMMGREADAIAAYSAWLEDPNPVLRGLANAAIGALTGDRQRTIDGVRGMTEPGFADPEGLYFLVRYLARVGARDEALALLERVVDAGFTVPSSWRRDSWLDSLRDLPRFDAALARADAAVEHARLLLTQAGGQRILGISSGSGPSTGAAG
jgi:non-specific serine/threonine protein kinase